MVRTTSSRETWSSITASRRLPAWQLLALLLTLPSAASAVKLPQNAVQLEITRVSRSEGSFHWRMVNRLDVEVYVYNVFLLGPAFRVERFPDKVVFAATPITIEPSCPPNRFLPVLLLIVRGGGSVEGDFQDDRLKSVAAQRISFKIAVGPEPYTVVVQANRFLKSDCKHSPYNAIVDWGTLIESNSVQLSDDQ